MEATTNTDEQFYNSIREDFVYLLEVIQQKEMKFANK